MGEYLGWTRKKIKINRIEKAKNKPGWYNVDMFLKDRKNFFIFIFLIIISLAFTFDLFVNNGQPASFDGPTHLTNIAQFYKAIKDGDILPRWADGFANYGMPIPIIAQQTTSYLGAVINFFFQNIILSYNLAIFIGTFFSALFFYLFLRLHINNRGALLGTFLFQFAPYRILNVYIRGALPEFFAGVFFPLILIALHKWIKENKTYGLFLFAFSVCGLLMTHPFTLIIYSFFIVPYTLYLFIGVRQIPIRSLMLLCFGLLGMGLASYYIIPLFLELKYFYYGTGNRFLPDQYLRLSNYINPGWYYFYRDDIGTRGHFIIFGIIETFSLIIISAETVLRSLYKKKNDSFVILTLVVGWITVFMTSKLSIFIYENIPLLGKIQHPWRMMSLFIYIVPILLALYSKKWNYWLIALFIFIVAVMRFPQLYGKNYKKITQQNYFFTVENLHGEILNTIWTGKTEQYPVQKLKPGIISGRGTIERSEVHNSWRRYTVNASNQLRMVDHTFYFPGWRVYVDGKPVLIEFQDMNYRGVITYYVPPGRHEVLARFEETKVRLLGDIISIFSIGFFALVFYLNRKHNLFRKLLRLQ